tara:strand:+ start:1126 stop:1428 length:303 start_codon:yes stop_codon:yes gene_type:complete
MDKKMLNEFRRLSGQDNINENTLNEDEYTDMANVVATGLADKYNGDSNDVYQFILDNKEDIKNMELTDVNTIKSKYEMYIKIITLLGENPEELKKLKDNL